MKWYVKCAAVLRPFIPQSFWNMRCGRLLEVKFHLTRSLVALEGWSSVRDRTNRKHCPSHEIWSYKRDGCWWGWSFDRGSTVYGYLSEKVTYWLNFDRFCHKNSARPRFGDDKMLNFTKPFGRTQTNSLSMVYFHDNLYLYDCIWRLYYIFLCLCSLPSILCCTFTYFPHLSTTPFTKPFNANWHC